VPLALVAAAMVAAVTIVAASGHPIPLACAYGAGALVAFYGLGPGSGASRRPIRRMSDAVAATPLRAAAALIALIAVVIASVAVAASHPPFFWPLNQLTGWLTHFGPVRTVVHDIRSRGLRVLGRSSG